MANQYTIDWAPPDITPGVSMLLGAIKAKRENERAEENTAIQRMYADAQIRRQSSQEYRDQWELYMRGQEAQAKRAAETAAAIEHAGDLARTDPGLASAYGAQFGIDIKEKAGGAPPMAAPPQAPSTTPEQGRRIFTDLDSPVPTLMRAAMPQQSRPSLPDQQLSAGDLDLIARGAEGPRETPPAESMAAPGGDLTLEQLARAAAAPEPTDDAVDRALRGASPAPQVGPAGAPQLATPRLFQAVVGGKTYDLNTTIEPTGLGEKYDALYKRYMMEPGGRKVAFQKVLMDYEKDQHEAAANKRTELMLSSRDELLEQRLKFLREENAKYRLTAEQQEELRRLEARSRMASAGATPTPAGVSILVGMKEEGASGSEIAAEDAKRKIAGRDWAGPVGAVTREAATAERAGEKRAGLEINDMHGNFLGYAHNTKQANDLKKQTDQMAQAKVRLQHAIADIEENGPRILKMNPTEFADAWQKRLSNLESVNAAMRVYNGLGATDASQRLEARITGALGAPGHGWFMGANLDVLKNILHELELQHDVRLHTAKRTGPSTAPLAPALGGPRRGGYVEPSKEDRKKALMDRLGL